MLATFSIERETVRRFAVCSGTQWGRMTALPSPASPSGAAAAVKQSGSGPAELP